MKFQTPATDLKAAYQAIMGEARAASGKETEARLTALLETARAQSGDEAAYYLGLTYFQLQDYKNAINVFESFPNPAFPILVSLLASYACSGDTEASETTFDRCLTMLQNNNPSADISLGELCNYYSHALMEGGLYSLAMRPLELLKDIHSKLGITDSHFLFQRQIPSFEQFISMAQAVFGQLGKSNQDLNAWLLTMAVDDDGQRMIKSIV